MRYTLTQIADIVGGTLHVAPQPVVPSAVERAHKDEKGNGAQRVMTAVATDSRSQLPAAAGEVLFVAIRGTNHDGHEYIGELYQRGVRGFLVQMENGKLKIENSGEEYAEKYPGAGFVVVPDTLEALQRLAGYHREQYAGEVVGITGSNGKTVVKEWIAQLWPGAQAGKLGRSPRSYNSQLGVALSLLLIEGDERVVVIEAGISKPGEMERLERMIRPTIGVLTHVGEAHQENFASIEQKVAQKKILFRRARQVVELSGREFADANAENRAIVEAVYGALGIEPARGVELQPVAMRLQVREGIGGSTLVDDSYTSDPTSLALALDFLRAQAAGAGKPAAVILSDIRQSGIGPEELYGRVAEMLQSYGIEHITGIGEEISGAAELFKGLKTKQFYPTTEAFLHHADRTAFAGKAILVKGSRAFEFEKITRALEKRTHTTVLEVNLSAMASNLSRYRAMLGPGVRTMAMVKAFGYGSGGTEVASLLQHQGVDYLAVAFADEGVALREGGIHTPIVVLNSDPGSFAVMADHGLEPEVYSMGSLRAYVAEIRSRGMSQAGIHIKLDTGMHRLGFMEGELPELLDFLRSAEAAGVVRVRSVFSHLAAAEDPAEDAFTQGQIDDFERMSGFLCQGLGDATILRHIANSAAIRRFPRAQLDMVRLGIGLYGADAEAGTEVVSTLRTQIVQIRTLEPGQTVGYNRRGTILKSATRVATIPIGYADGMDRRLGGGVGGVSVRGALCRTIGNICMDTCMIDITGAPAEVAEGDEVIIWGASPTVEEVSAALGTIPYEVLTSVSARIKRIYTRE